MVLKGDLPIGVDKRSVDTWLHRPLFRMDKNTGAPPDYFDRNGQNWGFPTYNWGEMGAWNVPGPSDGEGRGEDRSPRVG